MEELAVEGEYSRDAEDSLALVVSAPFLFAFFGSVTKSIFLLVKVQLF